MLFEEHGQPYDEEPAFFPVARAFVVLFLYAQHRAVRMQDAEIQFLFREPIHLLEESCMHEVVQYLRLCK